LLCDGGGGVVDAEMFSETQNYVDILTGSENRHSNSIVFIGLINDAYTACE